MATIEAIWKQAERDLVIPNAEHQPDVLLWEHSSAVAQTAMRFCTLPSIAARKPDTVVLAAAALYHDAYFAAQHRGRGFRDNDCITRAGDAAARDHSAEMLLGRLKDLLEPEALQNAGCVVREAGERDCTRVESRILSDVDNLHQLGLLTLLPLVRQTVITGKGAADLVDRWRVWKDYGVWPARRESFYFGEIQRLATQRVEAYDHFIQALQRELAGGDLLEILDDSQPSERRSAAR